MKTIDVPIGKGIVLNVDIERLFAHDNVTEYVVTNAIRNLCGDAHASATRDLFESDEAQRDASRAMAMKKLQGMYDGLAHTRRATASGPSAFEKVMNRVFLSRLPKDIRTKLAKMDDKGAAWIAAQIAANKEKVEGWAKEYVAEQEARELANAKLAAELTIDISAL